MYRYRKSALTQNMCCAIILQKKGVGKWKIEINEF